MGKGEGSVCATCVITLAITPTYPALPPSLPPSRRLGSRQPPPSPLRPASSDGGRVVTRY